MNEVFQKYSKQATVLVVCCLLSFLFGYYGHQNKTTSEQTRLEQIERREERTNTVKDVHETEYHAKDGTKKIERTIKERIESKVQDDKKSSLVQSRTEKTGNVHTHRVQVGYLLSSRVRDIPEYSLGYEKRIFGPVWFGAQAPHTFKEVRFTLSLEF